jgi:hypothetical protein
MNPPYAVWRRDHAAATLAAVLAACIGGKEITIHATEPMCLAGELIHPFGKRMGVYITAVMAHVADKCVQRLMKPCGNSVRPSARQSRGALRPIR